MGQLEAELHVVACEARAVREQMQAQHAVTAAAAYDHIVRTCERFITTAPAFPTPAGQDSARGGVLDPVGDPAQLQNHGQGRDLGHLVLTGHTQHHRAGPRAQEHGQALA